MHVVYEAGAMTLRLAFVSATILLAYAPLAHAGTGPLHVGADLVTAPSGDAVIDVDGFRPGRPMDLAPSFGVDLHADYALSPVFRVGLGERVLYPTSLKYGDSDSGFQADTLLRAVVHAPVTARVSARVRFSAGYSIVSLPDPTDVDRDEETTESAKGFVMGLAAGAAYQLTPAIALVGDVGHSWGFQGASSEVTTETGTVTYDVRFSTNLLHVSVGAELSF
jgi:hypothetical protein